MSENGVLRNLAGNGDGASDGVYTVIVFDDETGCATMQRTLTIDFEPDRPNFTPVAKGDASSPTRDNSVCDIALTGGTYNGQITINPDIIGTEADYTLSGSMELEPLLLPPTLQTIMCYLMPWGYLYFKNNKFA